MTLENLRLNEEWEFNRSYDAILVHSFWISRGYKDVFKGSLRSRLATRAAALLFQEKKTNQIVAVGGKVKGPSYPSNASVISAELKDIYDIPETNITTIEDGFNTNEEVNIFFHTIQQNNWQSVACVSFEAHKKCVTNLLASKSSSITNINFISVEDIINKYDNEKVKSILARLDTSKYQVGYKIYEGTKTILRRSPILTSSLLMLNKRIRTTSNNNLINNLILHSIDKFNS